MIKINLVPVELQKKTGVGFNYLYLFVIPVIVAVALVPVYTSKLQELKKIEVEITNINQQIERHAHIEEELNRIRSEIDVIQAKISFIEDKRKRQLFWNKALDRIVEILPPNIWLTSLSLDPAGGVSLTGNTFSFDDVSKFITALNRSPIFSNVKLSSTNKTYGGDLSGGERVVFSLSFTYREVEK